MIFTVGPWPDGVPADCAPAVPELPQAASSSTAAHVPATAPQAARTGRGTAAARTGLARRTTSSPP